MVRDYILEDKTPKDLRAIEILPSGDFHRKDLTRIMKPRFDPQDTLKKLEIDLTLCSLTDITRPDKSNLIRRRKEKNQIWDSWIERRMKEISAQEQKYSQMVSSAVENGQMDSSEANRVLHNVGTQFGPFSKLKQETMEMYNQRRRL